MRCHIYISTESGPPSYLVQRQEFTSPFIRPVIQLANGPYAKRFYIFKYFVCNSRHSSVVVNQLGLRLYKKAGLQESRKESKPCKFISKSDQTEPWSENKQCYLVCSRKRPETCAEGARSSCSRGIWNFKMEFLRPLEVEPMSKRIRLSHAWRVAR